MQETIAYDTLMMTVGLVLSLPRLSMGRLIGPAQLRLGGILVVTSKVTATSVVPGIRPGPSRKRRNCGGRITNAQTRPTVLKYNITSQTPSFGLRKEQSFFSVSFSSLGYLMSNIQQDIAAAVTIRTANLVAQLSELNELRERVREAELLVRGNMGHACCSPEGPKGRSRTLSKKGARPEGTAEDLHCCAERQPMRRDLKSRSRSDFLDSRAPRSRL